MKIEATSIKLLGMALEETEQFLAKMGGQVGGVGQTADIGITAHGEMYARVTLDFDMEKLQEYFMAAS